VCFVLKLASPRALAQPGRGPYLGLCPAATEPGGTDSNAHQQMRDGLLRRLLVSAAHYILVPSARLCVARLRAASDRTSMREKKRAWWRWPATLAVLLLSLWKHGTIRPPRAGCAGR